MLVASEFRPRSENYHAFFYVKIQFHLNSDQGLRAIRLTFFYKIVQGLLPAISSQTFLIPQFPAD